MSLKAPCYTNPAIDSGKGNLNCDVVEVVMSGVEVVDVPILLRKMSERNTYIRATIVPEAGVTALSAIDLGFIDREGSADDLVALGDGAVLTVATQNLVTLPVTPGVKHDICFTPKVVAAGDAGKKFYVVLEFLNTSS